MRSSIFDAQANPMICQKKGLRIRSSHNLFMVLRHSASISMTVNRSCSQGRTDRTNFLIL